MSINDYEKQLMSSVKNTLNTQDRMAIYAHKLAEEIFRNIAARRMGITLDRDELDNVWDCPNNLKSNCHTIELLARGDSSLFSMSHDKHYNSLMDEFFDKGYYIASSTENWRWYTDKFDTLMRKENVGYEWYLFTEPNCFYAFVGSIFEKYEERILLPAKGDWSVELKPCYRSELYIHLWYD